jgi:hypothetical protein
VTSYHPRPHAESGNGHDLSPRAIRAGAIAWPSFLLAGVATMVFFAFIDPHDLNLISFPRVSFSRELGYTLGFFLLWTITALSSWLTAILLATGSKR